MSVLESAVAALAGPGSAPVDVDPAEAAQPGLYAFHADAGTWQELGLGKPPDARPLYVGKAESTLAARDLQGHFGRKPRGAQSPTGSSTVRRSLAALLAPSRGYAGVPRNPANPGHFSNFGLSVAHDDDLSTWMEDHLRLSLWPHADSSALDSIETLVLAELSPPLNIDKVTTPWRVQLKDARKLLAAQARAWSPPDS